MDERVVQGVSALSSLLEQPVLNDQLQRLDEAGVPRELLLVLLQSTEHPRFEESLGVIVELIDAAAPDVLRNLLTSLLYNLLKGPFTFPGTRAAQHADLPEALRPDDSFEVRCERALTAAAPTWLRLLAAETDRSAGSFGAALVELLSVLPEDHERICAGLVRLLDQPGDRGPLLIALARLGARDVVTAAAAGTSFEEELQVACAHAMTGHASPLLAKVVSAAPSLPLGADAPFVGGTSGELLLRSLTRLPSLPDPDAVVRAAAAALEALPVTRENGHAQLFRTLLELAAFRPITIEDVLAGRTATAPAPSPLKRQMVAVLAADTIWDSRSMFIRSSLAASLQRVGLPPSRDALREWAAR